MKRDMDLVRKLLIVIEGAEGPQFPCPLTADYHLDLVGYAEDDIEEHLVLLVSGKLITRNVAPDRSSPKQYLRLAWEGHEFLEVVRNDSAWKHVKSGSSKIGSFGLGIMKDLAVGYLKQEAIKLGYPIG